MINRYDNAMKEKTCTIVTSEGGDQWVHLPKSGRVFYRYKGEPRWSEAIQSWASMSRHIFGIKTVQDDAKIPSDIVSAIE